MSKSIKIKVPFFVDDPGIAAHPTISPFPLGVFDDYLIIENGKLNYHASKLSIFSNKSFDLDEMKGILVSTKRVTTCWKKDFSWDMWGRLGTDISLLLLDHQNKKHELIPTFFIPSTNVGRKAWDKFVKELSDSLNLSIFEETLS